ncbi:lipopolysaccharide biosynthesis protein [Lactobacillus sp. HBUAS51381]|uniref:lipopolysaccharide biosynthesis protein n=1 Tax=Lactobacillus sp. HBUAS51381 TaxID=2722743 RepID=UPI001456F3DA|nr:transporter [Lactobacillus sp. HBUAS51381]NLR09046.1 transporter [Lactobacillus sp. HBUAS51381]
MHRKLSRTHAAVLNSSIASLGQILTLVAQFIARTFFIHVLGQKFLGLNGLFVNVLSFLNFAELGIGSAVTFALYEPLASNNHGQIAALMVHFKRWYRYIALVVFLGGLCVMPFLPHLIHDQSTNFVNIYIAFALSLSSTVASYLVSYKRTLLIANQQGYLNTLNTVGYSLIQQILQIVGLLLYSSYYLYLIIQLIFMIISNLRVSRVVDRLYPYLLDYPSERIDKSTMNFFKKNVLGMLSAKAGGIVVNGTDNILLSYFVGLTSVGVYSNYTLIITGLTNVLNQAVSAVASSIGNLAVVEKSKTRKVKVFYKYYFLSALLIFFAAIGFTAFSSTFVRYWVGERYVYTQLPLLLIAFNFYLQGLRQPIITYTNAYGLYWYERYKPILESIVNLFISVLLLCTTNLEVSAVLIGTISSNVLVNLWWEPLIVFRWGLRDKLSRFMLLNILYVIIGLVTLVGVSYIVSVINYDKIFLSIAVTLGCEFVGIVLLIVITNFFWPGLIKFSEFKKKLLK